MAEVKCTHCGEMVYESSTDCPKCGKPIANPDAPTDVPDSPRNWKSTSQKKDNTMLYIIVGGIIVVAVILILLFK